MRRNVTKIYSLRNYVVPIFAEQENKYSARWVLQPPSVRVVEVAKASAAAKARVWV